jgi:hypothetical protein
MQNFADIVDNHDGFDQTWYCKWWKSHLIRHSLIRISTPVPTFDRNNLEIQSSKVHTEICPCLEMVFYSDSSTNTWGVANGDILIKGRRAFDGRLIHTLVLPNGVGGAVAIDSAFLRT